MIEKIGCDDMKKIAVLILTLFLFVGCNRAIDSSELYDTWAGNTLENVQSYNGFIITKTDYMLALYEDNTFHEEIQVTSRNISEEGSENVIAYTLDGTYEIVPELGVNLKVTKWSSNQEAVTALPNNLSSQTYYFEVNNRELNLCIDADCTNILVKSK